MAHGADDQETIALFPNVEIGKKNVELIAVDLDECFRDASRDMDLKTFLLEDGRESQTNAGFIINKKNTFAGGHLCRFSVRQLPAYKLLYAI